MLSPVPHRAAPAKAAAAAMRSIGLRRTLHHASDRAYVCVACAVSWTGQEADCWNCGEPASTEYADHRAALRQLLAAVGRRPAKPALPGTQTRPQHRGTQ